MPPKIRAPLSASIFVNLCKTVNTHFESYFNSSTLTLRQKFAGYNAALRGAGGLANAETEVVDTIELLKKKKQAKYNLALDYVDFCLGRDRRLAGAYTTGARDGGGKSVSAGGKVCLEFLAGTDRAPNEVDGASLTSADGQAVMNLAVTAIQVTRSVLYRGTLNNLTYLGLDGKTPAASRVTPSACDPGRDVLPTGANYYYCDRPGLATADRDAPKYINDFNDMVEPVLVGEKNLVSPDIPREMAAKGFASWYAGGAVCAMCAHVAAGVLTMLSPPGTRVCVAFDCSFDHSYVVIQRGTSPWITVDAWPGHAWAMPWRPSCWFPPRDCKSNFEIKVNIPVSIPYGVEFAGNLIEQAINRGKTVQDWRDVPKQQAPQVQVPVPQLAQGGEEELTPLQKAVAARKARQQQGVQQVQNDIYPLGDDRRRQHAPTVAVCVCHHWKEGRVNGRVHAKENCPAYQARQQQKLLDNTVDLSKWAGCRDCASGCKLRTSLGANIPATVKQLDHHYFHATNLGPANGPLARTVGVQNGYVLAGDFGDWGPAIPTP